MNKIIDRQRTLDRYQNISRIIEQAKCFLAEVLLPDKPLDKKRLDEIRKIGKEMPGDVIAVASFLVFLSKMNDRFVESKGPEWCDKVARGIALVLDIAPARVFSMFDAIGREVARQNKGENGK